MNREEILSHVDHTLLKPEATWPQIQTLCDEAIANHTASVCINTCYVKQAVEYMAGRIPVCCVVGFPLGAMDTASKAFEAKTAIENGAAEVDMVINIGRLKNGEYDAVREDIRAVKQAVFTMHMQMGKRYHLVLLCSKFGDFFQSVAESRLGDGRVKAPRKLGEAVGRIPEPQPHGFAQAFRKGVLPAPFENALDRGDLPRGSVRRLDEVRSLAVDLAVYRVAEVLLDLRLHQLHCGVGCADAREEVLDARAVLEVEKQRVRPLRLLG